MNAVVVCFISAKGGSGKTVTSSALGTFLSSLGFAVLLVDTDAATNGMTLLYLEQLLGGREKTRSSTSQIGLFEASPGEAPTHIKIDERLHLVPATYRMKDTEINDHGDFSRVLDEFLFQRRSNYDFIFLDAQAGTDNFARTAARAADFCVIVSEYDPVSAQGIERLKLLFGRDIHPSISWTLFNKVLPEFAKAIGEGLSIARYLSPLPWDADVVRAFARRDLAIDMKTPNAYTLAISEVAYGLFPDATGDTLSAWRHETLQAVANPIEERLRVLENAERNFEMRKARSSSIRVMVATLAACMASVAFVTVFFKSDWFEVLPKAFGDIQASIVGGTLAALASATAAWYSVKKKEWSSGASDKLALEVLREEQSKLRTTLDAARAALKASSDPGPYERRRRLQASAGAFKRDNLAE